MATFFNLVALFLFFLAAAIFVRAFRADPIDRPRYLRAGVGAMAVAAGNALLLKQPQLGMLFYLMGALLILTGGRPRYY